MSELFDALDRAGKPTGQKKTKVQILADGDWWRVVHVWVVNSRGELLTQQRAKKLVFDDCWDVSVGGGLTSGERPAESAVRELAEELGLIVTEADLEDLGEWPMPKFIPERNQTTHEFSRTFLLRRDVDLATLTLEPREVVQSAWLPLDELEAQITNAKTYPDWVPHPREYYLGVLSLIHQKMAGET